MSAPFPNQGATTPQLACVWLQAGEGPSAVTVASPEQRALWRLLQRFSPEVAPDPAQPRRIYLNVAGLLGLYPDHTAWAQALAAALARAGVAATLTVGWGRFWLYALAHALPMGSVRVHPCAAAERSYALGLPLACLPWNKKPCAQAYELGLRTLACLLRLPEADIALRLGAQATALAREARHHAKTPLAYRPHVAPCAREAAIEPPDTDATRLLFVLKRLLPALMDQAQGHRSLIAALHVTLTLEGPGALCPRPPETLHRRLEAGRPGTHEGPWLELLRLALDAWPLPGPVEAVTLRAELTPRAVEQLALWPGAQRRDAALTDRAISQLRAALGPEHVTCAQLRQEHLPEASFAYAPVATLPTLMPAKAWPRPPPAPGTRDHAPPLMRRVFAVPRPLGAALCPQRAAALSVSTATQPPLALMAVPTQAPTPWGPYRLSGNWWQAACDRDYYYVPRADGAWLWTYFDRQARRWLLHGMVD